MTAGQNCACTHGYVLKLDSRGEKILSASYLTGNPGPLNDNTGFTGIALDSKSNVVVVGSSSADFPLVLPIQSESSVGTTGFGRGEVVAEMNADLSSLLFATFLHGSSGTKLSGVAIGPNDRPVITGATWSIDFPTTAGAFQQVPPSPSNPYAINPHSVIAEIDLAGAGATACLEQKSVDFGKVMVGTPSTKAVSLANCGNAPLSISSVQSSIADFTVTQNCGAIAPGDKCAISLTFTPSYTSDIFGTVTLLVNSVSSTQTISVQGRGGSPVFYPYSTGDLGDMLVGSNPKEQGFYILNNGDMPMVVTAASATGDFTAGMGTCSTPVEPQKYCSLLLSFLPTAVGTRTGTLTVSDNAPGSPHTISLKGNGVDSYPVPQITAVVARLLNTESTGIVQVLGDFFFPATTLFWNGEQRTTWFGSENTIGAGLNAGDLSKVGEVPVTVLNPTPGGGFSNTYLATVYARMSDIRITHMVVEPRSGLLYATVSPSSKNYADSVIAIDPATMTVVKSIATGGTPNHLAVSDDGSLLYVGLDGARQVAQIALPAGTVNFKVSLPIGSYLIQPLIAHSLIVLPGNPHAWVVVTCDNDYLSCGTGIAVYDDSTARPNVYTRSQLPADSMTFVGSDTTKLFATTLDQSPSTFYQFAIDAAGITLTSELRTYPAPSLGGESLASDGTYIYVANGQVIDPVSQTIVRTLQVPGGYYPPAMAIDPANSRLYSAGLDYNGLKFAAFDRLTGNSLGSITFPEAPMATEAARWGSNGIAVLDAGTVMIFRTRLTGTAPAPMAVPAALDFSSQLVTKSSSSKSVVFTNTGLSELAITSVQATGSDFSVSSNCPPSLASGANCTIAVIFTPKAGGARTGTLTIAHNGEGSPTSVALRGDGSDFSLSAASSSATVNAGASASYSLRIAGTSGFSGTASLSCSGAPTDATCAASPTSVDLSGTTAADISVTVTTKARVVAAGGKNHQGSNYLAFALLSLLSLGVIVGVPANKLTRRTVAGIAVLMIVSAFGACGGGGGSKVQPPPTYVSGTPAGTYSLTVTATVNGVSRTTTLTLTVN